jgi:heme/copper-type cytochrome/quinol oxidase subunit 4
MKKNIILIPIYNDWKSLNYLINKFKKIKEFSLEFIIINDCSTKRIPEKIKNQKKITVINLKKNIGSQGCIAVGLNFIKKNYTGCNIILMDGDGEDNPNIVRKLIDLSKKYPKKIITVNRTTRTENFFFKILYELNLIVTALLSLKYIRFGNFSLLKYKYIAKILSSNDIWFSYSASIAKNFNNIKKIYVRKEKRYFDKSKKSYYKLIFHALKIQSVFRKKIILTTIIYIFIFFNLFNKINLTIFFILTINFAILNFAINLINFIHLKNKPKKYFDLIKDIKSY